MKTKRKVSYIFLSKILIFFIQVESPIIQNIPNQDFKLFLHNFLLSLICLSTHSFIGENDSLSKGEYNNIL